MISIPLETTASQGQETFNYAATKPDSFKTEKNLLISEEF